MKLSQFGIAGLEGALGVTRMHLRNEESPLMPYYIRSRPDQTEIVPVRNSVIGSYMGNPWYDTNYGNVRVSWDVQGATYGTDGHQEPTPWYRNWGRVTEQPFIGRRFGQTSDGWVWIDVVDTFYPSRSAPDPYAWAPSGPFSAKMENLVNRVDTELLAKLQNQKNGITAQLGASLAEIRTTADMLAGAVIPPVKALLYLRKGNWRYAMRLLGLRGRKPRARDIAGRWLEWQYGWKPMLQDVHDVYTLLSRKSLEPMTITLKHSRRTDYVQTQSDRSLEETGRAGIGVTCDFMPSGFSSFDAAGLTNPASIGWEIVPFSFVVDWFVPVGNTLGALTATVDLQFKNGYRNSRIDQVQTYLNQGSPDYQVIQQGKYVCRRGAFNRVPMPHFPTPKLYANENPLSTPRILNAVALLTQLFTGR